MPQDMKKPLTMKDSNPMLESKQLVGLNGWLGWIQALLIIVIAMNITVSLLPAIVPFLRIGTGITDISIRQVIFDVVQTAIATICLVLFYTKKRVFLKWFFALSFISVAFTITNYIINKGPLLSWLLILVPIGIFILINVALLKSQRVKNTFS